MGNLNLEVEKNVDFGVRAITRARLDLWCKEELWLDQGHRDPQKEGALFNQLSTLFEDVKRTQSFSKKNQDALLKKLKIHLH